MTNCAPWLSTVGLLLDLIAVWIVAGSVIVTHAQADKITTSGWGGVSDAAKNDRIAASRKARCGGYLFTAGIALQIIGAWM